AGLLTHGRSDVAKALRPVEQTVRAASPGERADLSGHESRLSGGDRVQRPAVRDALEIVLAALGEPQARSGDQVSHRARDEDLTGLRECGHAGADVYGEAADVVPAQLTFPDVQPGADLDSKFGDRVAHRLGAA